MKVSVPNDFGGTRKKPILPLVREPTKSYKKEELTTVSLHSDRSHLDTRQILLQRIDWRPRITSRDSRVAS